MSLNFSAILRPIIRAFRNMAANRWLNLATIFIVGVALFVVATFSMVLVNLQGAIHGFSSDPRVSAYLSDSISPEAGRELTEKLGSHPRVEVADYIGKEQALNRFTIAFGEVAGLVEDLGENPLPASIELTLSPGLNADEIDAFAQTLTPPTFEQVDWGKGWAERFSSLLETIELATMGLGTLLLLASTVMIANTIHLTVYARREELTIQRLVGATGLFIRVPFMIEGLIQGLIGAGCAMGMLYLAYELASPLVNPYLRTTLGARSLLFLPTGHVIFFVCLGAILAIIANMISVHRYLKQPLVSQ